MRQNAPRLPQSVVLGRGSDEISPTPPLTVEGAIEIGCGSPKRTVPRVTTSELSTRDSTGTRIGDGSGGRRARRHLRRRLDPGAHVPGAKRHASNHAQNGPENVYALLRPCRSPSRHRQRAGHLREEALRRPSSCDAPAKEITHSRRSGKYERAHPNWSIAPSGRTAPPGCAPRLASAPPPAS